MHTKSNSHLHFPTALSFPSFIFTIMDDLDEIMKLTGTHRWAAGPSKPTFPRVKGYFAFPPTVTPDGHIAFTFTIKGAIEGDSREGRERQERASREAAEARKEAAWQERRRRDVQLHEERLARERAEALTGEMAWVRAGGSLRDAHGRRDKVRTEQLRAEIRLLDEEARLTAQWNAYEARWCALLAVNTPVTFKDVPWPLPSAVASVDDLVPGAIEEFLFGPLRVRRNTVTKRERFRASFLRWHPDKMSALLQRVVPEDESAVQEGVKAVFRCLRALQEAQRRGGDLR